MGWDAYATKDGKCLDLTHDDVSGHISLSNASYKLAFEDAAKSVVNTTGAVDGYLMLGALDCTVCGMVLSDISGYSVHGGDWTPGMVKSAYNLSKE